MYLISELSQFCFFFAAPNFVSSFTQGDFVYFFFRETAVEFINCGKVCTHTKRRRAFQSICSKKHQQMQSNARKTQIKLDKITADVWHFPRVYLCSADCRICWSSMSWQFLASS